MSRLRWLLFPLSLIYDAVTRLRNFLFDISVLQERCFSVPTIAIGNLSVGGTGKTPHVEYLLSLLFETHRCATLSRGYGRKTSGFAFVAPESSPTAVGDEPLQIKRKYPKVVVAVDENRCHGMEQLLPLGVEVVLLDDAFQHRYLRAGLRILLTDYAQRYTEDHLLPMGRLREARKGATRADIVIVTKCPADLSQEEQQQIATEVKWRPEQEVFFTSLIYDTPYPLFPEGEPYRVSAQVLLVTGIAQPAALHAHYTATAAVKLLRFSDHHHFTDSDIAKIEQEVLQMPQAVTTEKDATRLLPFADRFSTEVRRRLYVQPMRIQFLHNETFFQYIIQHYVNTNQRNS